MSIAPDPGGLLFLAGFDPAGLNCLLAVFDPAGLNCFFAVFVLAGLSCRSGWIVLPAPCRWSEDSGYLLLELMILFDIRAVVSSDQK
jgi:hypothetical protein